MAIEDWEVDQINLILWGTGLLAKREEQVELADRLGEDIVVKINISDTLPFDPPIESADGAAKKYHILEMNGIQVRIVAAPRLTSFNMRWPRLVDLPMLARIVGHSIDLSDAGGQKLHSIRLSLLAKYRQLEEDSTRRYLADRISQGREWKFEGEDAIISIENLGRSEGPTEFEIGPLPNDPSGRMVRELVGMRRAIHRLPDPTEILALLNELWESSCDFATIMDENTKT